MNHQEITSFYSLTHKEHQSKFIDKMTESVIIFFFASRLLNGKLKLTLNFAHEKIINHNIVSRVIKLVFNPN